MGNSRIIRVAWLCVAALATVSSQIIAQAITVQRDATGVVMHNGSAETMHITVCGPNIVHVVAGPGDPKGASPHTPWITSPCKPQTFDFAQTAREATLKTAQMRVSIQLKQGLLFFRDSAGHLLLMESFRRPRVYLPETVNGEKLYRVSDRFMPQALEGFYGLGQHQSGAFNYNGNVVELAQANTDVAVPLLLSTNGYGILWNTAAHSWFDNRFPTELKLIADAADAIDYYFIYGPEMDQVIHAYRDMTGHAPLFGKWAYGFIQSKDRYRSAKELLDVAAEYRDQHVPLDMIVQDWFWWKRQGDPEFTDEYLKPYPDVPGAIQKLHDEHVHTIISTWAVTDEKSDLYKELKAQNLLIPGTTDYDATNPKARDVYWHHLEEPLMKMGWDGYWLDSAEPECCGGFSDATLDDRQLFIGNGARYTNIFPLMHSGGVYTHWRAATDRKRIFILTRSAFLGQQRYATTVWSGDVIGTFPVFKKQIAAGLNFELSGIPYWTTDIAGYGWPYERDTRDPKYQELYTRWYQFGAFCPIFRTHGHRTNNTNEIFSYGPQVPTLIQYDKLRYRMLPYIYSLAWKVTSGDYTIMRPLVMDWREDANVRFIGDQYMFGPSILVNPVTEEGATQREVYLPPAPAWYDFWTGEKLEGGKRIMAPAPLNRIPLYIKAGSILPLGPEVQYATEKPDAPITLRIYRGADADFTLYEDAGDTYDYEKGQHATIPLHWNDAAGTLTLAARQGSYPGMPQNRDFRIVLVGPGKGAGPQPATTFDKEIHYTGAEVTASLK
ncbi:MAG: TIM-barrel domain-containing protein [Acidobacteriota bacterium]